MAQTARRLAPLCERFTPGESWFDNDLGQYFAAPHVDRLPAESYSDYRIVRRGYAVGIGTWFFFDAFEPAIAFGRAARMSIDCSGYGVYRATHEQLCCLEHHRDESVLHIAGLGLDRKDGEAESLKRFTQAVKENPHSARWNEPTGFIADEWGARTSRRSLPL